MMLTHVAFSDKNNNLEQLAERYQINIIWCPKYHCELNPIKGIQSDLKKYVRKHNKQDYNKLLNLILDAMDEYEKKI